MEIEQRLMRLPEVRRFVGLSRSEIYRLMALGRFPKAVGLGERAVAWTSTEVQAFIAARIAARKGASEQRRTA